MEVLININSLLNHFLKLRDIDMFFLKYWRKGIRYVYYGIDFLEIAIKFIAKLLHWSAFLQAVSSNSPWALFCLLRYFVQIFKPVFYTDAQVIAWGLIFAILKLLNRFLLLIFDFEFQISIFCQNLFWAQHYPIFQSCSLYPTFFHFQ